MSKEKIGFIGLGKMGRPMASNLAGQGYNVQAYDVRPEAAEDLEESGVAWGGSVSNVSEKSSVIFVIVFSADQVRSVMLDSGGVIQSAAPGTVVVDMTSSDPAITRALDPKCEEKGIYLIDAPVSGGVEAAQKGSLTFMVGGEEQFVDRIRPLLSSMGKKIIHMGPLGSGHAMKLMNNFLSATAVAATSEVVALARKAGIPVERVIEVLQTSTGTSDAATRKFPEHIFPDKEIGFTIELMYKDIKTYLQFAEKIAVPTFVGSVVHQIWNLQLAEGRGPKDAIHFVEPYERWCGLPIRGLSKEKQKDS